MVPTLRDVRAALTPAPARIDLEGARQAAVAAVLTPQLELVFMRRSEHPSDPWSGHLSFPGGRRDPGDVDLLATAHRETLEEVGVDLKRAELLGELDEARTVGVRSPLVIRPFVFSLTSEPTFDTNEEVASMHRLSLSTLLDGAGRGPMEHPWRRGTATLPRVDFDGVRLWGLTLHIVDDLLHRLDGRGRGLKRLPVPPAEETSPW